MSDFILEIGVEELPARFLQGLEAELDQKFTAAFEEAALRHGGIRVFSTPRRSVVYVTDMAAGSDEREEDVTGPPVKVAFGPDGALTKAGEGFLRTQGVDIKDTFRVNTDKGEYLAVRKKIGGVPAERILAEACRVIVAGLGFPKRMRWGSGDFTFARPLRWLLALLGDQIIPFEVGGVASGRETRGHRVHGHGPHSLDTASGYFSLMREKGGVTVDAAERRSVIVEQGNALAAKAGGTVLWKDSLLDEVQGLTEHPVPLLASFDPSFLEVPAEVLITSMESHQKSFGLKDADGKLMPHFLTVLNITPKDVELVRKGWERVLRARLEDARFFWKSDLSSGFDNWLERLDKVIFLDKLGSMGDKTRRVSILSGWLAERLGGVSVEDAKRAGRLSKADLVTEMVGEFDTVQGIMGSIYAARKGENDTVAKALAEQYLPAGPDTPVPSTLCGAIISMADKADTLVGCFGLGHIPTGAADPFALRRAALGIARIMEQCKLRFPVRELFAKAQEAYGAKDWKLQPAEALARLDEFFALRLKNYFIGKGEETLLVEGALGAGCDDVWAASARLAALGRFSSRPDFAESVLTFKRAANIIRKQGQAANLDGNYRKELLREPAESAFAQSLDKLLPDFEALWAKDDFDSLFDLLYQYKPAVDAFFDGVMVMAEEPELRLNRLNLLKALVSCLSRLADFDALQM